MMYDTKNRILHTGVYETKNITKIEHKFLVALKGGNFVTCEELCEKIYGKLDERHLNCIRVLKCRLRKKTKKELEIENKIGLGYRIKNLYYE